MHFGEQVQVAEGDLTDPGSLRPAMEGVSHVLLCSPVHPEQVAQQNAVIDAAVSAGRPYVVKISGLGTHRDSFVDSGRWHAETEDYLRQSGLEYTCLQPFFFMQNLVFQTQQIRKTGKLFSGVPHQAIAMVDARDISDAVVSLFAAPEKALNQSVPLTGDVLTYQQMAQVLAEELDCAVAFEPQTLEQVEANLRKAGQEEWHLQLLLQFNKAFNEGLGAETHPALEQILGARPRSFRQFVREEMAAVGDTTLDDDPFPS